MVFSILFLPECNFKPDMLQPAPKCHLLGIIRTMRYATIVTDVLQIIPNRLARIDIMLAFPIAFLIYVKHRIVFHVLALAAIISYHPQSRLNNQQQMHTPRHRNPCSPNICRSHHLPSYTDMHPSVHL